MGGLVSGGTASGNYGQFGTANEGVHGHGSGTSIGVYGDSSTHIGVRGASDSGVGVYGESNSSWGVWGRNNDTGNQGMLGTSLGGVEGKEDSSGNYGRLGTSQYGVYGYGAGANEIGVYGATTGTWGLYTPDSLYVGGDVTIEGNVTVNGQSSGFFPSPAYNSGWVSLNQGAEKVLIHNLLGNVDDYVVDMQFKSATQGVNQRSYGGETVTSWVDPLTHIVSSDHYGAYWRALNSLMITVGRNGSDTCAEQVRVRIWVYK